ncbi:MAG: LysR substrate-binding domain-containing protein, partial [Pseudomonadales bacterium]
ELRIGATLTIGNYVAVPILTRFRSKYAQIKMRLHVANTVAIAKQVLNFELDIGLIEGEFAHDDLEVTRWREDELVVFCAPDHPCARLKSLGDAELVDAQWVLRERGSGTRQTFDRAMQGLQNQVKIYMELEHTEAIKQAVAAGAGLGCLSRIALQQDFAAGRLVPLEVPGKDMKRSFYFVLHAQKYRSANLERWLAFCRRDGE